MSVTPGSHAVSNMVPWTVENRADAAINGTGLLARKGA